MENILLLEELLKEGIGFRSGRKIQKSPLQKVRPETLVRARKSHPLTKKKFPLPDKQQR